MVPLMCGGVPDVSPLCFAGTTLSVVADLQLYVAVLLSGSVTIVYTMAGSMISVAYTDVVQLLFIFVGLVR